MLHAVIMAGGAGTRFWPLSRSMKPKQLLDLLGGQTMILATRRRLGDLVPDDRWIVVTNQRLVEPIRRQLPELPPQTIIGEPCRRDTAPCVGLAAAMVARQDDDATMLVMPADHVIQSDEQFQKAISQAVELLEERPECLVTFGIRPTYPAETFGYIERSEAITGAGPSPTYEVARFREKPTADVAREYLETGNFYWNAGIFVWKANTIRKVLAQYEPEMAKHLETIAATAGSEQFDEVFAGEFAKIDGKSIDYAVLEHYNDVAVIEAPFSWDDLGNWQSLGRLRGTDEEGNTIVGKHLGLQTKNTIVRSQDDHLVVTLGIEDCIVVHTPDATLVANRHDEESIRQVVQMIKENGWEEYL